MTTAATRHSPVHDVLEHLKPRWGNLHDMPVALDFARPDAEAEAVKTLALGDLSALPRLTLKGPGTEQWLKAQGLDVPENLFGVLPAGRDGLIARTGGAEFFVEDGIQGNLVPRLARPGKDEPELYRVLRQDAALVLMGARANEVMLETCGYDFSAHELRIVFSRVAGVSCSILPQEVNGVPAFRLWCDGTYGPYLWDTLLEIVSGKGGGPAGLTGVSGRTLDGAP